jgi:hypothetical protein
MGRKEYNSLLVFAENQVCKCKKDEVHIRKPEVNFKNKCPSPDSNEKLF